MSIAFDIDADEWGKIRLMADGTYGTMDPDKWVIHWGGSGSAAVGLDAEIARIQSWDRYHTNTKGWAGGFAYNFAVGDTGTIFRGRGVNQAGATSGDIEDDGIPENKEALAAVWIGGAKSRPSDAAYAAYERLIESSNLDRVIGHMEVKPRSTACPGPDLMAFVTAESWLSRFEDPASVFENSWAWGLANNLVSAEWSDPWKNVSKQELVALFQRYDRLGR